MGEDRFHRPAGLVFVRIVDGIVPFGKLRENQRDGLSVLFHVANIEPVGIDEPPSRIAALGDVREFLHHQQLAVQFIAADPTQDRRMVAMPLDGPFPFPLVRQQRAPGSVPGFTLAFQVAPIPGMKAS